MNFAVARIVRLYERHPQPAASFLDVRESVPRTVSSCQLIEFPFGTATRRRKPDNLIGPPHGDHTPCEIRQLFDSEQWVLPELMAELDAIKNTMVSGLVFRRDHEHRKSRTPLPWITERKDLRYLRSVVKEIVAAAGIRNELSFTSFRHGGFTEGADSDLTDAELRAAGRHRSARQLPTYAKRTRKQLISGTKKRREERTKAAGLSE